MHDELLTHDAHSVGLWVWHELTDPDWWISLHTGAAFEHLTPDELAAAARADPAHPVLVWRVAVEHYDGPGTFEAVAQVADVERGDYLVVRADQLAAVIATV